jgi:transglutaminase-like putative cysteine protease
MRKLGRLLVFNLGLLVLLLGLVWLARQPDDLATPVPAITSGAANQTETSPAPTRTAPAIAPTQPEAPATESAAGASPTIVPAVPAIEPVPSDLILDPGDPFYNDAPTQTITSTAYTIGVVNLRHAHLTFEFVFQNDGPGEVTRLDVYATVPESRGHQRISDLEFSGTPHSFVIDRYDQEMAHFQFGNLAPGQRATVSWEGDVELQAMDYGLDPDQVTELDQIPPDILTTYTTNESKYRLESQVIQDAAQTAARGASNPYAIARNVHDFVARRLSYSNDGRWDDAETVYLQRTGSCSEYSFLYIALCRANGLPARYVAGTRQRKESRYVDTLFHRWTEVYLPPYGWVPVDALHDDGADGIRYDYFGGISDERFATTVSGGDSEYLGWNYHYGYRYDEDGTKPEVSRNRRFIWQPYAPEIRGTADSVSGYALPDSTSATFGELGILSTNGSYAWSVHSSPSWLRPDKNEGVTPDLITLTADTTGLELGLHTGEITLQSEAIGAEITVPVEVQVVEALPVTDP